MISKEELLKQIERLLTVLEKQNLLIERMMKEFEKQKKDSLQ